MPSFQIKSVIGSAATAAVLFYSYCGTSTFDQVTTTNIEIPHNAPIELKYDYYELLNNEQSTALEQVDIIHKFASDILDNIKDLDPDFSKTVDENFWDLI